MKRKILGMMAIGILCCSLNVWTAEKSSKRLMSEGGLPENCPSGEHPYCSACACYGDDVLVAQFFASYPQAAVECGRKIETKKRSKAARVLHPRLVELYKTAYVIDPEDADAIQPVFDALLDEFDEEVMEAFSDVLAEDEGNLEEGLSRLSDALSPFENAYVDVESSSDSVPMAIQEEVVVTPGLGKQEEAIQEVIRVYGILGALYNKDKIRAQAYLSQVMPLLNTTQKEALLILINTPLSSMQQLEDLVRGHFVK